MMEEICMLARAKLFLEVFLLLVYWCCGIRVDAADQSLEKPYCRRNDTHMSSECDVRVEIMLLGSRRPGPAAGELQNAHQLTSSTLNSTILEAWLNLNLSHVLHCLCARTKLPQKEPSFGCGFEAPINITYSCND